MATKFYLSNRAPAYSPATLRGAWDDTGGAVTKLLDTIGGAVLSIGDEITTVARAETSGTDEYDVLLLRAISGPLAAQTITGTINLIIGVRESAAAANFYWHLHIYVTQGDSDTPRGTLLTDYRENTTNEWPSAAAAGHNLNSAQTLTDLAVSLGDRLVIEIGYTARNTATTSYTGTLYYGARGLGDLTDGGDETLYVGNITFSDDITFDTVDTVVTRQSVRGLSGFASAEINTTRLVARTLSPSWNSPIYTTRVSIRTLSEYIPPGGTVPVFDQYYRRMRQ